MRAEEYVFLNRRSPSIQSGDIPPHALSELHSSQSWRSDAENQLLHRIFPSRPPLIGRDQTGRETSYERIRKSQERKEAPPSMQGPSGFIIRHRGKRPSASASPPSSLAEAAAYRRKLDAGVPGLRNHRRCTTSDPGYERLQTIFLSPSSKRTSILVGCTSSTT